MKESPAVLEAVLGGQSDFCWVLHGVFVPRLACCLCASQHTRLADLLLVCLNRGWLVWGWGSKLTPTLSAMAAKLHADPTTR